MLEMKATNIFFIIDTVLFCHWVYPIKLYILFCFVYQYCDTICITQLGFRRDILHEFTIESKRVGDYILKSIAKQLELKEDFFVDQLDEKAEIYARFTNYPHCTQPDEVYGIKPHSDGSVMTILLLDKNVGGLQVEKDNEWVDIPTVPNSLLIIFGDHTEVNSFNWCLFISVSHFIFIQSHQLAF